jgi:hypothetical protein
MPAPLPFIQLGVDRSPGGTAPPKAWGVTKSVKAGKSTAETKLPKDKSYCSVLSLLLRGPPAPAPPLQATLCLCSLSLVYHRSSIVAEIPASVVDDNRVTVTEHHICARHL